MLQLALFLVPGFIKVTFSNYYRFYQKEAAWEYLLRVLSYSLILIFASSLLCSFLGIYFHDIKGLTFDDAILYYKDFAGYLYERFIAASNRHMDDQHLQYMLLTTYLVSIFLGWLWGLIESKFGKVRYDSTLGNLISDASENSDEPYMIRLTSGRVYVATIVKIDMDPNNKDRHLQFEPVVSGQREEGKLKRLVFDTWYMRDRVETDLPVKITLPYREVLSLSKYNPHYFDFFVKQGRIQLINFPKAEVE